MVRPVSKGRTMTKTVTLGILFGAMALVAAPGLEGEATRDQEQ